MIDFASMPVTAETQAKLHGLILALAIRLEPRSKSAQKIIEEEWKRVEDVWTEMGIRTSVLRRLLRKE